MSLQIVKPSTPVITKIGNIKAIVTGVCIRNESIYYEISYFGGGEHKTTWIYRYEFDIDTAVKQNAGLKDFNTYPETESQYLISLQ